MIPAAKPRRADLVRTSISSQGDPAPDAWAVKPLVPILRKPNSQNIRLKRLLPSATPARYTAPPMWPVNVVSISPRSGVVIVAITAGTESASISRCLEQVIGAASAAAVPGEVADEKGVDDNACDLSGQA